MGAGARRNLAGFDLGLHAAAGKLGAGSARHSFDLAGDALDHGNVLGVGLDTGRRVIEPVDVGEQYQEVRTRHGGDPGGEPVIVAIADLVVATVSFSLITGTARHSNSRS